MYKKLFISSLFIILVFTSCTTNKKSKLIFEDNQKILAKEDGKSLFDLGSNYLKRKRS